jgi:HEAT repeat protein/beta-lactamase regulating signal transducer with metallopeptidase domain
MNPTFSSAALAWLLTYAIHSTALLGLVWLLTRVRRLPPVATDVLWKVALFGGVVTASVQQRLDVQPSGILTLPTAVSARAFGVDPTSAPIVRSFGSVAPASEALTTSEPPVALPPPPSTGHAEPFSATSAVVIGWGIIALVLALIHAGRRLMLVGRLGDRQPVRDPALLVLLEALRHDVGYRGTVRLTCANGISSPVALGGHEICLPQLAITDLDGDQQRSMLAHELAHLTRHDPLWFDAAALFERVFFFQPLNRLARRELETAAEYVCDEWAMRKTGSGIHLARCLATVAEWIQAAPLGVPVAGMAEQRSLLVSRIARLLDGGAAGSVRSRRGAAALAALLLIAMIAIAPRVSGHGAPAQQIAADTGERNTAHLLARLAATDARLAATNARLAGNAASLRGSAAVLLDRARGRDSQQPADSVVVLALIARLKDEDADVRRAAARSLGRLEDPRAIPGLIESLKDGNKDVRAEAADALASFEDPRAVAPLAALLSDSSTDVRHNALEGLSRYETGVPVAPVIRLLGDSDADVRQQAVHLLRHIGDRSAAPAIARLIHDPSPEVRGAVISALAELGAANTDAVVVEALTDANADVRQAALQALGGMKAAIPQATLLALLKDSDADVRHAAAELAGRRSIVAAIPQLRQMLDDPKADVREGAVDALSNIADPAAREALRAALNAKDPKVRRAAAEALGDRP